MNRSRAARTFVVLSLVAAGVVLATRAAWVGDDAFITYRTADNLVHGFGPVWNTYERVQVYTNPLWMLLFSGVYAFTRDAFYTSIGVQLVLSAAALWVMGSRVAHGMGGVFVVFGLLLSKAFVDYSTSGLENPLTHFLLAVFFALYLRKRDDRSALGELTFVASLAVLTRLDTAIVVFPPLFARTASLVREQGFRHFRTNGMSSLLVGASPLLAFLGFCTFYYGFPFPNTAYAKLAGGLPLAFQIKAGLFYLHNSLFLDPITLALIALSIPWAFFAHDKRVRPVALGILLHVAYTVRVGGDFMSGRFLTVPLVCAVAVLCSAPPVHARFAHAAVALFALLIGRAGRFPSLSDDYATSVPVSDANGISDARRESRGVRLADATRFRNLPSHPWVDEGKALKSRGGSGVSVKGAVGLLGYYAGPKVRILDPLALTDPLLARLPIPDARHEVAFRAGHLLRAIPEGYRESIETGKNCIEDPGLAAYYEKLRLITQGPLFAGRRIVAGTIHMPVGCHTVSSRPARPEVRHDMIHITGHFTL
jgi:arabinofuranosyltransferase